MGTITQKQHWDGQNNRDHWEADPVCLRWLQGVTGNKPPGITRENISIQNDLSTMGFKTDQESPCVWYVISLGPANSQLIHHHGLMAALCVAFSVWNMASGTIVFHLKAPHGEPQCLHCFSSRDCSSEGESGTSCGMRSAMLEIHNIHGAYTVCMLGYIFIL